MAEDSVGLIATMTDIPAETRLAAAVIQQAVRDAKRPIRAKRAEEVRAQLHERVDAIDWLESAAIDWIALITPMGSDAASVQRLVMQGVCQAARRRYRSHLDSGISLLQRQDPVRVTWEAQRIRLLEQAS